MREAATIPTTDSLPPARTTHRAGFLCVLVWCRSCHHEAPADLQALVDAGRGFTKGLGAPRQPGDRSRSEYFPDPPLSRRPYSVTLPCLLATPRAHSDKSQPARPGFPRWDRRRS
jgi:hypothetical protein